MTTDPAQLVDLYLRLSNADDDADSLERQESDLRAWVDREGLTVRLVHRDYGRSGYTRGVKREGFDAAIKAVTSGEVRALAIWKLDRLSRQGAGQVGLVLDDVEHVGGRLVFLKDGLDTSTGTSARLPIVTLSEIARAESANTGVRVRSRKAKDRLAGRYLGGPSPYGYALDADRRFIPSEPQYSIMREVVGRVIDGDTLLTVCRDLNAREVPTGRTLAYMLKHDGALPEKRSEWRVGTLSTALRSPCLAGLMPQKRKDDQGRWLSHVDAYRDPDTGETVSLMADGHEPIASEATQARMLTIMDGRLRRYGRGLKGVKEPGSLLGGLLFCASCQQRANTFGTSYRCRKWHQNGHDCQAPLSVTVGLVEDAVKRRWVNRLAAEEPDSPLLNAVADRWLQKYDPQPLKERAEISDLIAAAEARVSKADADHYTRGTLDETRHARVTSALTDQIVGLRARLAELPEPEADLGALLDPELSLPALDSASVREARDLLRLAIVRVEVTAAPYRGARFNPAERMRVYWVGEGTPDH